MPPRMPAPRKKVMAEAPPARAPAVFILTRNGQPVPPPFPAPPGATDLHVVWDPLWGVIVAAWWTFRGIPGPLLPIPRGANDWFFGTPRGGVLPRAGTVPPWANDCELFFDEDGQILELWWTVDGRPVEQGSTPRASAHFATPPQHDEPSAPARRRRRRA